MLFAVIVPVAICAPVMLPLVIDAALMLVSNEPSPVILPVGSTENTLDPLTCASIRLPVKPLAALMPTPVPLALQVLEIETFLSCTCICGTLLAPLNHAPLTLAAGVDAAPAALKVLAALNVCALSSNATVPVASGSVMVFAGVVGVQLSVPVTPADCITTWLDVPDRLIEVTVGVAENDGAAPVPVSTVPAAPTAVALTALVPLPNRIPLAVSVLVPVPP